MKALDLFPVTIYQTEVRNNGYYKDLLLPKILEASEYLEIPEGWDTNKLKTSFEGEPEGMEVVQKYKSLLKYEYESCLDEIFDKEYQTGGFKYPKNISFAITYHIKLVSYPKKNLCGP